MNKTKIEWCDSTWNPVTGCLHGCEYCYARRIAERFKGKGDLREAGTGFWLDKDSFEVSKGSGLYETKYALTKRKQLLTQTTTSISMNNIQFGLRD